MSETKNTGDKTLTVAPKTLSLKRPVEQGVVRQSFSHGRTKAVVVEKVKRRQIGPGEAPAREPQPAVAKAPASAPSAPAAAPAPAAATAAPASAATASPATARPATATPRPAAPPRPQTGVVLRTLTDAERD